MQLSQKILSDITVFNKYAKYIPEIGRRETWDELVERNMVMHIRKYPQIKDEIRQVYKQFVFPKKVLTSMRSLQFGGLPIELANNRIFNCAMINADDPAVFPEVMFNLLSGSGQGYSVQKRHIDKLPVVKGVTERSKKFLITDDIQGWADAVKALVKAYFQGKPDPVFDYRAIRQKGIDIGRCDLLHAGACGIGHSLEFGCIVHVRLRFRVCRTLVIPSRKARIIL